MVQIRQELQNDHFAIENLLDLAFGKDRLSKVSYRFRSGLPHLSELRTGRCRSFRRIDWNHPFFGPSIFPPPDTDCCWARLPFTRIFMEEVLVEVWYSAH